MFAVFRYIISIEIVSIQRIYRSFECGLSKGEFLTPWFLEWPHLNTNTNKNSLCIFRSRLLYYSMLKHIKNNEVINCMVYKNVNHTITLLIAERIVG